MCKVLNSNQLDRNILPANTVNISRGTKWDKKWRAGIHGTKAEVLEMHKHDLASDPQKLKDIDELVGKNLLCHCAPRICHGDILLELAGMTYEQRLEWASKYLQDHAA